MKTADEELLNDQEAAIALSELTLDGLIDWNGDEDFKLNEKGYDYAWVLWKKLPPKERVALFILFDMMQEVLEDGKEAD